MKKTIIVVAILTLLYPVVARRTATFDGEPFNPAAMVLRQFESTNTDGFYPQKHQHVVI
jgi:hypothetical protein